MSKERTDYLLDIEKVLSPKLCKKLPRFAISFLKKRIHQDDINGCIMTAEHYKGVGFFDEALDRIGITYKVRGKENIEMGKRYIFACNHPLGGPEALIIGSIFRRIYGEGFLVPSNKILSSLKPLTEFFIPVSVGGNNQNRSTGERIAEMFASDKQVLIFPSGLCAKKIKGKVTEEPWKKMFITQSKKYQRDVVPVHISGHNSQWYFFLSWLSRTLGLKFNIGMLYLVDELFKKAGEEFVITFGKPVPYTTFDKTKTDLQWANEIKEQVRLLSLDNGCPPNM